MANIYHQLLINTTPSKLYKAISEQEGISKWWISNCIVKPEIGFINKFHIEGYVDNKMKITDLQIDKRIEWECVDSEKEWIGTHIIFEISKHNNYTKLTFKQINWKDETDFFASCNFHWARHLTMLKEYCENGTNQINNITELEEIKKVKK